MEERFISIGTIIIDDIILPDGITKMGTLGGGLTHAAMGMRAWSDQVGIISGVGKDFDNAFMALLREYFEIEALCIHENEPTPRAWQVFDVDGTRNEIFQTKFDDMKEFIPGYNHLLDKSSQISGVHLHCPPEDVRRWVPALRKRNCKIILWEPWDGFCVPDNQDLFSWNSKQVDIVSPNLREGRTLTGLQDPHEIIARLRDFGAQIAVLRMGEAGSLIIDGRGNLCHISAFPVNEVVDVTGAGNAYCGGFIVGLSRTGDTTEAGWYGAVSASFALEQFGALYPLENIHLRVLSRLAWYKNH